jgi:hypothetical protein
MGGRWIHKYPERRVRGFHISALYSLFHGARWEVLVEEFLAAKEDPSLLQVWVNTVLGETFEEKGERVDASTLASRCKAVRGAGTSRCRDPHRGGRRPGRSHRGKSQRMGRWPAVVAHRNRRLLGRSGLARGMGSARCRAPQAVQARAGAHARDPRGRDRLRRTPHRRRIRLREAAATPARVRDQGLQRGRPPDLASPAEQNEQARRQAVLDRDRHREGCHLLEAASEYSGAGVHELPAGTSDEYFAQLTGEKKVRELANGRPVYRYKKIRPRNEALDLEVYNLAALQSLGRAVYDHLERWVKKLEVEAQTMPAGTAADDTPDPPAPREEDESPRRRRFAG